MRYWLEMEKATFQELVKTRGHDLYRDMPWRRDTRPYYILVSELMLQQTQVARVVPKFEAFIARFPDTKTLAKAPLAEVLKYWSGLGYNRRARYLHMAAQIIERDHDGRMPDTLEAIKRLPGVGDATAGAIMVYAFNRPVPFIETNVRAVYFHCFFADESKVSDAALLPLITETMDQENPREFYRALMDYGAWLKKHTKSSNAKSIHYKKQSKFSGSVREVRGRIVRLLGEGDLTRDALADMAAADERFEPALNSLVKDGLVTQTDSVFHLTR